MDEATYLPIFGVCVLFFVGAVVLALHCIVGRDGRVTRGPFWEPLTSSSPS